MKVCEVCGNEFDGRDGDNVCSRCEEGSRRKRARAKQNRLAREDVYASLGLVKVRGACGGTYWE